MSNPHFPTHTRVHNASKVIKYYATKHYILKKLKRNKPEVAFDLDKIKIKY